MRSEIKDRRLRNSIVQSLSRMWNNHDWTQNQVRRTRKYKIKFRFLDKGPYFHVTDLNTKKEYSVEMYHNYGFPLWGVYKKERTK